MDGDTIVVGAPFANDNGPESGAVYIFERNAGGPNQWGQVAKLIGSNVSSGDRFGAFLELEGNTLVVGAYMDDVNGENSGSAYVFERNQGGPDNWGEVKWLVSSDNSYRDRFGWGIAIYENTIVIGAYQNDDACPSDFTCNSGAAYIFERNDGGLNNWGEVKKITASDMARLDRFGWDVDLYQDTLVVSAITDNNSNGVDAGAIYIFERDWGGIDNWGERRKIIASDGMSGDEFGNSVTIYENTVVGGARYNDANGSDSGAAYIFERDGGGPDNWGEIKILLGNDTSAGDLFGNFRIKLYEDWVGIGAPLNDAVEPDAGSVYIFARDIGGANNWGELAQLTVSDAQPGDQLGFQLVLHYQEFVAGARFYNGDGGIDQGAAYIFSFMAPTANDDSGPDFTTDEDTPFTTGSVLENDIDPANGELIITSVDTTLTQGLLTNNGTGTFNYDPNDQYDFLANNEQSFDTFAYTISNTFGLTDTAIVTITILGVNDVPIFENENLDLDADTINENDSVTLSGSFFDIDINDTHTVEVNWGDGQTDTLILPAGVQDFEIPHTYLDDEPGGTISDIYTITVTVHDSFSSASASTTLTVNNVDPILSNLVAVDVNENGFVTLTGEIIDPGTLDSYTLNVEWGDGQQSEYLYAPGTLSFSEIHQYLDDNPSGTPSDLYTMTLTLTDDDTGQDLSSINITVNNVAPTISNLNVTPTVENGFATLSFDLQDPGTQDTFSLMIDWGDGTIENIPYPAGTVTIINTHQYLDDNPTGTPQDIYIVNITLTDDDTGMISLQTGIVVINLSPIVNAGENQAVSKGTLVHFSGTFADAGTLDTHTIQWDFGDGTTTTGTLTPSHLYSELGIYTVILTVIDDDSGVGTDSLLVHVTESGTFIHKIYLPVLHGCEVWYFNCLP